MKSSDFCELTIRFLHLLFLILGINWKVELNALQRHAYLTYWDSEQSF